MSQPLVGHCGVVGDPIDHSLSPVLHRAGYAALGLDWQYDAWRVSEGTLADFLASEEDWRGLSVTMPLKREALLLARSTSDRARSAGAANTLINGESGVHADNTDIAGAMAALQERVADLGEAATILGGGATAASVGLALIELGVSTITLLVRDPERAATTSLALMTDAAAPRVQLGDLARDRPTGDVLVSTIPAAAQVPELVERCADVPVVFEVLYDPWPTPLAASASDRILVGGLDLLVHQAAEQFRLFTGRDAPLADMRAAGERALADRRP
jgi:shikimate dehydrogenase